MQTKITLENAKGYATEANLTRALERTGLSDYGCRYIISRKPDGTWTAIFLVMEFLRDHGGYVCFASEHGFMSV
jgi:hypothetical protein